MVESGVNEKSVCRVGSPYDTGKVSDYETEGLYTVSGAEHVCKHKESEEATYVTEVYYGDAERKITAVRSA